MEVLSRYIASFTRFTTMVLIIALLKRNYICQAYLIPCSSNHRSTISSNAITVAFSQRICRHHNAISISIRQGLTPFHSPYPSSVNPLLKANCRIRSMILSCNRVIATSSEIPNSYSWTKVCKSEEDIENFGKLLGQHLDIGDVVLLKGDLGAGKTTLSRGLVRYLLDDFEYIVTSPSYLLDNRYDYDEGKSIHHIDLYRLPTNCDLSILEIPGIYSTSLCLIEWPQRMAEKYYPKEYLQINMVIESDLSRRLQIQTNSSRLAQTLESLFSTA